MVSTRAKWTSFKPQQVWNTQKFGFAALLQCIGDARNQSAQPTGMQFEFAPLWPSNGLVRAETVTTVSRCGQVAGIKRTRDGFQKGDPRASATYGRDCVSIRRAQGLPSVGRQFTPDLSFLLPAPPKRDSKRRRSHGKGFQTLRSLDQKLRAKLRRLREKRFDMDVDTEDFSGAAAAIPQFEFRVLFPCFPGFMDVDEDPSRFKRRRLSSPDVAQGATSSEATSVGAGLPPISEGFVWQSSDLMEFEMTGLAQLVAPVLPPQPQQLEAQAPQQASSPFTLPSTSAIPDSYADVAAWENFVRLTWPGYNVEAPTLTISPTDVASHAPEPSSATAQPGEELGSQDSPPVVSDEMGAEDTDDEDSEYEYSSDDDDNDDASIGSDEVEEVRQEGIALVEEEEEAEEAERATAVDVADADEEEYEEEEEGMESESEDDYDEVAADQAEEHEEDASEDDDDFELVAGDPSLFGLPASGTSAAPIPSSPAAPASSSTDTTVGVSAAKGRSSRGYWGTLVMGSDSDSDSDEETPAAPLGPAAKADLDEEIMEILEESEFLAIENMQESTLAPPVVRQPGAPVGNDAQVTTSLPSSYNAGDELVDFEDIED